MIVCPQWFKNGSTIVLTPVECDGSNLHFGVLMLKQAALPQGIVPFVFAKEYNIHPDILSTA